MQREDDGITECQGLDLDYPAPAPSPSETRMDWPRSTPAAAAEAPIAPAVPVAPAAPLSPAAKRKLKKRQHDRAKRQQAARDAENSTEPPAPGPRVLKKAAQSSSIELPYSAAHFRASLPRWTGLRGTFEHPLLAHARDTEHLKAHMQYVDWKGE